MARRTKAEMERLDQKIRPLYERGVGCRIIGEVLDENPVIIFKRVKRMGIGRSQEEATQKPLGEGQAPFSNEPQDVELRKSAMGVAIRWFLERGYMVSIPVEPAPYDLVVESDRGLKRVQVKSTTQKAKTSDNWITRAHRTSYDPETGSKTKRVSYTPEEIDLFFIVTADLDRYLVPLSVTRGRHTLTLDHRFDKFKCG